ncbi:MAG: M48 family metalloprotease [bacterium]
MISLRQNKLLQIYFMLFFGFSMFAGCQTTRAVRPFSAGSEVKPLTDDESRLWMQGNKFDETILNMDQLYKDAVLQSYLQEIMDLLYPEFKGNIHVLVLKSPILNAFALPHGSIYIHLGILGRFDNEAQVASVLAHEGAHFVQKHALKQRLKLKSTAAFATFMKMAGIPLVDVLAFSSIYGYSRDLEREADEIGYQRLKQAGYDTRESVKAFMHLKAEVEALEIEEPFFFSSHPKLQERIENFTKFNRDQTYRRGRIGEQEYLEKTSQLRLACLREDLSIGRYKNLIFVLSDTERLKHYPPDAYFYQGEAYRLRDEKGDQDLSVHAYIKCIEKLPYFAPPYRALGLHYMKKDDSQQALYYLSKYLQIEPDAEDKDYIRQYIRQIQKEQ